MEQLCDLLFELSNEDRLNILLTLREQTMRLSHVSKKLDFTVQETSRNTQRLSDAGLIRRNPDSTFSLTPYGEEALSLLPGYEFLSKNSGYFTNHTLSALPLELSTRIGDLVDCTFTNDVMMTFHHAENMMKEAEDRLLFIAEQVLTSLTPVEKDAVERGVEIRSILPADIVFPPGSEELFAHPIFQKANAAGQRQTRYLDRLDVCLAMSEKEVAGVSFSTLDGRLDHLDSRGQDERTLKRCEDMFEYYWEKAKRTP